MLGLTDRHGLPKHVAMDQPQIEDQHQLEQPPRLRCP